VSLADIKDQLVERLKDYGTRISESESFILLSERFHNLSPLVQKVITGAALFLVGFLLYTIPAGYITAAQEAEDSFNTNRQLLRGLYRVARNPTIPPERFSGPDFNQMQSKVNDLLNKTQVLDTQKGAFSPAKKPLNNAKVPSAIHQEGMEFEVKKLNLKQVVALSEQVSALHPNTKLASVQIVADPADPHYFNVKYTLSSLSVPIKQSGFPKGNEFKKKK
jgi:hypothetical protein